MAKYIDREDLLSLETVMVDSDGFEHFCVLSVDVRSAPAADVAQVVRCVECKYAYHCPNGYIYCQRDGRNAYEMVFKKDDFCSYGERKEG